MKAIILAAGRGSRMGGLTDLKPKCLVELRGKTLLDYQVEALKDAGISEIALVTGYMREKLSNQGLIEFHNSRWADTNMVSSLCCADNWLKSDNCLVSYSDIFYDSSAVSSLIESTADIAVTYDTDWKKLWEDRFGDPLLDAETFRMNPDKTLAEIGNKPDSVDEVEGQYMGLLRFSPRGWEEVLRIRERMSQLERDKMHMTGTLQKIIEARVILVSAVQYSGEWGEVDSQTDLDHYASP